MRTSTFPSTLPTDTVSQESITAGYATEQLHAAFDLVKDESNWKNPINATVTFPEDVDFAQGTLLILNAIVFFTASSIDSFADTNTRTLRVEADGYYVAVGA